MPKLEMNEDPSHDANVSMVTALSGPPPSNRQTVRTDRNGHSLAVGLSVGNAKARNERGSVPRRQRVDGDRAEWPPSEQQANRANRSERSQSGRRFECWECQSSK